MIGIYDSGMGGITVLAHLLKRLPHENYFYMADYLYRARSAPNSRTSLS